MFTIVAMYVTMTNNSDYGWIFIADGPNPVGASSFACPQHDMIQPHPQMKSEQPQQHRKMDPTTENVMVRILDKDGWDVSSASVTSFLSEILHSSSQAEHLKLISFTFFLTKFSFSNN